MRTREEIEKRISSHRFSEANHPDSNTRAYYRQLVAELEWVLEGATDTDKEHAARQIKILSEAGTKDKTYCERCGHMKEDRMPEGKKRCTGCGNFINKDQMSDLCAACEYEKDKEERAESSLGMTKRQEEDFDNYCEKMDSYKGEQRT